MESGVKELNLIAEDTNQYGQDRRDGKGLAQLMHELGKLEGLQWMRILYAYPSYFTETLIDEIANNPKVAYLHLFCFMITALPSCILPPCPIVTCTSGMVYKRLPAANLSSCSRVLC